MNKINLVNYPISLIPKSTNIENFYIGDPIVDTIFLAYKLYYESDENIFIFTQNNNESIKIFNSLITLIDSNDIIEVPSDELIRVEYLSQSKEMLAQQVLAVYKLTSAKHKVIIASTQSIFRFYPSKKLFLDSCFELKKGQEIDINLVKNKLQKIGYTKINKIDQSLQYASRGDILDVYSLNYDDPIRIEFFGDEIESIRQFKIDTQTSFKELESVKILPASLNLLTENEFLNAENKIMKQYESDIFLIKDEDYKNRLLENTKDDLELLKTCDFSNKFYKYIGFLQGIHYNLTNFVDSYNVIITSQTGFNESKDNLEKTSIKFLMELHNTAKAISHLEYFSIKTPIYKNAKQRFILDEIFSNQKDVINLEIKKPSLIATKQSFAVNLFKTYLEMNYKVFCLLQDPINYKKTIELLKSLGYEYKEINNINIDLEDDVSIYIINSSINLSYEITKERIVVLTEKELYGMKRHTSTFQNAFKEGKIIGGYEELEPGDYVVHENYGIGKFVGITTLEINNIHQDYMEIHYAKDEKLFVPLYQFNLVRKYIGREGRVPRLSTLNSSQWAKTKQKIKERVNELADRLLLLYQERQKIKGFAFKIEDDLQRNFENQFAHELTVDQKKAVSEIKKDMESEVPMDRLLCGDVGFGKTEVAFITAFKALNNGKQVAMLCPTTLLARQHYEVAIDRFKNFDFGIGLLTRLQKDKTNKDTISKLKNGEINFAIGTHKLLSDKLIFKDLGLLIIDEEQRFGVEQKEKIKEKFTNIDVLTLSATPIPRTLQSTLIGLKTVSTIDTPPKERMPIQTYVIPFDLEVIKELIKRELSRQGQIFYVHNEIASIYNITDKLQAIVPECRIGIIHAKMEKEEIENTMFEFYEGQIDMLVATSIIENGIDVRNANLMLIEDADHFGLAQLYQIKGRVGRGDKMAFAYLMVDEHKKLNEDAKKRLKAIQDFTELGSGYKISQRDLLIRGAGDILGPEQAGFIDSIGIDMYIKILNETVEEKKNNETLVRNNKITDIKLDGYIPSTFANDSNKLELYQRILDCKSLDKLNLLKLDIKDIYGKIPDEVETLFIKKEIDIYANDPSIDKIKEFETNIQITLSERFSNINGIASELFTSLIAIIKDISIKYEDRKIKITIYKNKNDYINLLLKILEVVTKLFKLRKGDIDEN